VIHVCEYGILKWCYCYFGFPFLEAPKYTKTNFFRSSAAPFPRSPAVDEGSMRLVGDFEVSALHFLRYGDGTVRKRAGNTVEENFSVFSPVRMR